GVDRHRPQPGLEGGPGPKLADGPHEGEGDLLQQVLQLHLAGLVGEQDGGDPAPVPLPDLAHGITIAPHGGGNLALCVGVSGRIRLHRPSWVKGDARGGGIRQESPRREDGPISPIVIRPSPVRPAWTPQEPSGPPHACPPTDPKPAPAPPATMAAGAVRATRTSSSPPCRWATTWRSFGPG